MAFSVSCSVGLGGEWEGFLDGRVCLVEGFQGRGSSPRKNMGRLDLEPLGTLDLSGYNSLRSAELRGAVESQDSAFIYLCLNFKAFIYSTLNLYFSYRKNEGLLKFWIFPRSDSAVKQRRPLHQLLISSESLGESSRFL